MRRMVRSLHSIPNSCSLPARAARESPWAEGEAVTHRIRQELTYRKLYDSIDNLWSMFFTTGYLTQRGAEVANIYRLVIPNLEIRQIFVEQIQECFQAEARRDVPRLDASCAVFPRRMLKRKTISITL